MDRTGHSTVDISKSVIGCGTSIQEAVKHMGCEAAMVVDQDGKLRGLVTDGDIRRAFLGGAGLDSPVSEIMTANPISIKRGLPPRQVRSLLLGKGIRHLPVVDDDGRPVGLELLKERYQELERKAELTDAVIMAGGQGLRLRPLTDHTPKPLLPLSEDETILDNVLSGLRHSGLNEIVITINYLGDQIKEHVGRMDKGGLNISFLEERERLDTAGALALLDPRPKNAFLVMNADLITDMDFQALRSFHQDRRDDLSVCVRKYTQTIPFGVVRLSRDQESVSSIEEKPRHECFVNAGIYLLEPHVVDLIPKDRPFDMVSLILKAISSGMKVGAFPILEYWRDIGRHDEMALAKEELNRKRNQENQGKATGEDESFAFLNGLLGCEVVL